MAYIQVTSTSETSITVRMNGLDTSWNEGIRTVYWYIDGTMDGTSTLQNQVSYGGSYTFRGLNAGTSYYIQAEVKATGLDVWFETNAQTNSASIQPWSWSSSNGSATASETQSSYNSLFNNGNVSDFSYKVWNDFCDKVYEVIQATGGSWNSQYTTYQNAKMSSSNRILTATKFNSLRKNIDVGYNTDIGEVSTGDIVYGWYFTTFARCLNGWIDSL